MTCAEARQLLHAYLDDELDLPTVLQIESHLSQCPQCQRQLEAVRAVGRAVAQPAAYYPASTEFRDRIAQSLRAESRTAPAPNVFRPPAAWWKSPATLSGLAAAVLLAIGLAVMLLTPGSGRGPVDELVAAHLRSLQAEHLLDVASTDQHTVKPWFSGKTDFSPPVFDLVGEGFPLVGGRLDYLDQRKVAALVFRRNKHVINVFIWPGEQSPETVSRQGFNLVRFECNGMVCWAVSDLNAAELRHFASLFAGQKPASTRE